MNLSDFLNSCVNGGIAFASVKEPGKKVYTIPSELSQVHSVNDETLRQVEQGFLVAPFKPGDQKWLIPIDHLHEGNFIPDTLLQRLKKDRSLVPFQKNPFDSTHFPEYAAQFKLFHQSLTSGELSKVVSSRRTLLEPLPEPDDYPLLFESLMQNYPFAFVYWIHIPGVMSFMGASPEVLLEWANGEGHTMSLAGTMPVDSPMLWGEKEREEQAIVSRYIQTILQEENLSVTVFPTEDKIAGRIKHLCTRYRFPLPSERFLDLALRLHPTPAIAGIPMTEAVKLIEEVEHQSRRFYAGFAGLLRLPVQGSLFVSLRSMEIFSDALVLYTGGGLTVDSQLEKEWEETERKAETLLSIIEKIRKFARKEAHDQR